MTDLTALIERVEEGTPFSAEKAAALRAAIREHCSERPGITAKEVMSRFGICRATAQRHMTALKLEWRARDRATLRAVAAKEGAL